MGDTGTFRGSKTAGAEADHSCPSNVDVTNERFVIPAYDLTASQGHTQRSDFTTKFKFALHSSCWQASTLRNTTHLTMELPSVANFVCPTKKNVSPKSTSK